MTRAFKARGFSEKVSEQLTANIRATMAKVYEAKWRVFTTQCRQRDLRPERVDPPALAEFLLGRKDESLRLPTLMGYKATIVTTMKFLDRKS